MMTERHISEGELDRALARIEQRVDEAKQDIKKEVRWLLVLGLGLSQLFRNIDIPAALTTTGALVAATAFAGKVVASYFFVR